MEEYYFYRQGKCNASTERINLPKGLSIKKQIPNPFVSGMSQMQIGYKMWLSHFILSFLNRGFHRTFVEYNLYDNNQIVSKAVLISKVPIYDFLPHDGIHLAYCETIPSARGRGYYPLLLDYIQNAHPNNNLYMIVKKDNIPSIKGIEKAGFVRYAEGGRVNGTFKITSYL